VGAVNQGGGLTLVLCHVALVAWVERQADTFFGREVSGRRSGVLDGLAFTRLQQIYWTIACSFDRHGPSPGKET
jgi:hypothetical protein